MIRHLGLSSALACSAFAVALAGCAASPAAEEVAASEDALRGIDLCHGHQEDRAVAPGTFVGGIPVVGPSVRVHVGLGGQVRLAKGTLAAAYPVFGVLLPAGSVLDGNCFGESYEVELPNDLTAAGTTFSATHRVTLSRRDPFSWNTAAAVSIDGVLATPKVTTINFTDHTLPVGTGVTVVCGEDLCVADSPGAVRAATLVQPLAVALGSSEAPETYNFQPGSRLRFDEYGYVAEAIGTFAVGGLASDVLGFCRYPQHLRSMRLTAPATIDGYAFAAWDDVRFYCDAPGSRQLKSAPKALPNTSVGNVAIAEGQLVSFYRTGAVRSGTLKNAVSIGGRTLPAGTFGCFDAAGQLREGLVPPFTSGGTHKFVFGPSGDFVEERTWDPTGCGGTIPGFVDDIGE